MEFVSATSFWIKSPTKLPISDREFANLSSLNRAACLRYLLFNRANYANPGNNLNSASTFGLITATRNGASAPGIGFGEPRNAQLALKLIW